MAERRDRFARTLAYLSRRKADPEYSAFAEGALVWMPSADHIFLPAKVRGGDLERGAPGGKLMLRMGGKVTVIDLSEEDAARLVPMGEANLKCLGTMSLDMPDLSEAALFHNLRLRFARGHHFMRLGDNVLVFLNHFFQTDMLTLATLSDAPSSLNRRASRFLDAEATRTAVLESAPELDDEDDGPKASEACKESLGSLVSKAFARLCESKGVRSQTLVVMGATAAGKRDVTKFILLRAIQLARPTNADWWRKLLAADTLLQAFGGEAFVRWTEVKMLFPRARAGAAAAALQGVMASLGTGGNAPQTGDFEEPQLLGAVYNSFGLDQARVTDPAQETFPVFYALLEAAYFMDPRLRSALDVGPPNRYRYLGSDVSERPPPRNCANLTCTRPAYGVSGKCEAHAPRCGDEDCDEPELGDGWCLEHGPSAAGHVGEHPAEAARAWHGVSEALATLGLSGKRRDDVVRILVGVLDIGNVDFWENPKQDPNEEPLTDEEDEAGERAQSARLPEALLGVGTRQLRKAFKVKTLRVKGETFRKVRPMREKYAVRDGVARVVYGALFSWLLARINAQVSVISDVLQKQAEAIEAAEREADASDASSAAAGGGADDDDLAAAAALEAAAADDDALDADTGDEPAPQPAGLFGPGSFFARLAGAVSGAAAEEAAAPARRKSSALARVSSLRKAVSRTKEQKKQRPVNALGNTGVLGVLENASLQLRESSLEDLFHNYRLERLHSFFVRNLAGRAAARLFRRYAVLPPPHLAPGALPAPGSTLALLLRPVNLPSVSAARSAGGAAGTGAAGANGAPVKVSELLKRFSGKRGGGGDAKQQAASAGAQGGLGVLQLIEEEVISPGSSDASLGAKIARLASHNAQLTEARAGSGFTVKHFGGAVPYNLAGFMSRMRSNAVPQELRKLLVEHSDIALLRDVLRADADRGIFAAAADEFEMQAAAEAAGTASSGSAEALEEADRFGRLEATRRLQAEMDRALGILGRTEVSFVVTLGANPQCDPEDDLDLEFLLSQLRRSGLSDAVSHRLYGELRGRGATVEDFVGRYRGLRVPARLGLSKSSGKAKSAKQEKQQQWFKEAQELMEDLRTAQLVKGRSAVGPADDPRRGRAFVEADSHFALETARGILQHEAAVVLQAAARGFVLRSAIYRHGKAAQFK